MSSLLKLEDLIRELITKVEKLSTNENLEASAAKIIKDISEKIDKIEEVRPKKVEQHNRTTNETEKFQKYSFPNFNVGNPSLGSSKCPNALTWPFGAKE